MVTRVCRRCWIYGAYPQRAIKNEPYLLMVSKSNYLKTFIFSFYHPHVTHVHAGPPTIGRSESNHHLMNPHHHQEDSKDSLIVQHQVQHQQDLMEQHQQQEMQQDDEVIPFADNFVAFTVASTQ